MRLQICINELLRDGADDWVPILGVAGIAQADGGAVTEEEIQGLSLKIIGEVLRQGLMVIGDVTEEGFRKWDLPVEEALEHVKCQWRVLGRSNPRFEFFCWFQNTAKGDEMASRLLEEANGASHDDL